MDPRSRTFLIAFLLALALAYARLPAWGAWGPYGNDIATDPNVQDQVSAAPDGTGGALLAWRDQRTDAGDIYVQRVSGSGIELWAPGGVPVCTAADLQQLPQIVTDGLGGAILVWQDNRVDPRGDIYAQRVNESGTTLWFPGGVPLITGVGENIEAVSTFRMVPDGAGGAIFTFRDSRNTSGVSEPGISKVWAERVTAAGSPLWSPGGIPVAAAPGVKYDNAAPVSDGMGGLIVAWQEASANYDIAAQHVDAGGTLTWGGGVTLCSAPNDQSLPDIVSDGAGGAIVAWLDNRLDANGDIYAQRVNAAGIPQWTPDGNALVTGPSANTSSDYVIRMILDQAGGATLAFADDRKPDGVPDPGFSKVWAQRVDLHGNALWGNGVPVSGGVGTHTRHVILTDTEGGSIVVWQEGAAIGNRNIFAQRFDPLGSRLWGPGVSVCNALANQTAPAAVADGLGGLVAAWTDDRTDNGDVYASMVNFSGVPGTNARWQCSSYQPDGAQVTGALNAQDQVVAAPDGAGGLIIAWRDRRTDAGDIYAQRVSSTGMPLWMGDGVPICTAVNLQQEPRIVSDHQGGAIIVWQDNRLDPNGDMYAQRVDALGGILWGVDGNSMIVGPSLNTQTASSFRAIEDGTGGAIFTFRDNRLLGGALDTYPKVWAQRVDPNGVPLWGNGTHVGVGAFAQDLAAPISDGLGGVIVAWQDGSSGADFNISAQRIDFASVQRWGPSGVVVCNQAHDQVVPDIASDGNGGAIIAWSDSRVDVNGDIYAQRLNPFGSAVWPANGIAQVTGPSRNNVGEHLIRMIPDGAGGVYLAFADNRDFGGVPDPTAIKVWAQRVKPNGFPDWGNGIPVGAGTGTHDHHQILSDGEGGAVLVWQDGTFGVATNIAAQRLRPTGGAYWTPGGVSVCAAPSAQTAPSVVPDGRGQAIAAWTDARLGATDVFAQRVCVPNSMTVDVPVEAAPPGARPALSAPAPNPSGSAIAYRVTLGRAAAVRVFLADVHGRVVDMLVNRTLEAGEHTFSWLGAPRVDRLAGGVYFLNLISGETRVSRKLVLLR